MQQSSMILFCDECGAANEPTAPLCGACRQPLAHSPVTSLPSSPHIAPISVAPPAVREAVAGATGTPANSGMPADPLPGTVLLGRYRIRQEIGRGGFSTVYLARDLARRRLVAIKRISLRALTPRQMMDATETWNREIKMLSSLKSIVGVPQLYENFADAENWYLAMQYIQGQTLEEYLQQAPDGYLSETRVVKIGIKLAEILRALHSHSRQTTPSLDTKPVPIIFRDVKPSNIMITAGGKLYLIDFGIARFFRAGQKKDTTPLGSPGYAPPEQYGSAQTDGRADIYGLGVTLQTLLTGRDPLELAQGEQSRNPNQPSAQLRQLLDEMLAPEASQRPPTMRQVELRLLRLRPARKRSWWGIFLSWVVGATMGVLVTWIAALLHFRPFSDGWEWEYLIFFYLLYWWWTNMVKRQREGPYNYRDFVLLSFGIVLIIVVIIYLLLQ
jgi:serine/threonine protein kinase